MFCYQKCNKCECDTVNANDLIFLQGFKHNTFAVSGYIIFIETTTLNLKHILKVPLIHIIMSSNQVIFYNSCGSYPMI